MQIAAVVDSFQGQDPFEGDGHMAKGRYMQVQGDTSSSAVLQEYLQAMTAYRSVPISSWLCVLTMKNISCHQQVQPHTSV